VREHFKQCCLGVNYGMQERSLAFRIQQLPIVARGLLELHRDSFRRFWAWSDSATDFGALYGWQMTRCGWVNRVFPEPNPRSLRNFPMQANGAELLRLACCLGTERGVRICAPVHDAVLIRAPAEDFEPAIVTMQEAMAEASRVILKGFELRSDVKRVKPSERYSDKRGADTFQKILNLL
jgi:DNA polymerase I